MLNRRIFLPHPHTCWLQIVVATLMNICDNPTRVSIAQGWRENDVIQRVPIIVTGEKVILPILPASWVGEGHAPGMCAWT